MTQQSLSLQRPSAPARARQALARRPVLAGAFGVLAALLAMTGSWIPSLWGDEAASVMSAERPLSTLFPMLWHIDAVHGTYYLGLHLWIGAFGASPFSIRFPSAIVAGVCVAGTVVLADRLSSRSVALTAGVICCILPRVTYMGEEARSYAFSAAIATWLTVLLIELLSQRNPPRQLWIAYVLLFAVGVYVFLYLVLVVLVHAAIVLAHRAPPSFLRRWLLGLAIVAATTPPLAILAFAERKQIAYLTGSAQATWSSIWVTPWFSGWWVAIPAWALIAFGMGGAVVAWRRRRARTGLVLGGQSLRTLGGQSRRTPGGQSLPAPGLPSLAFVASVWLLIPSAILISSQLVFAGYTPRYLTWCAPAAALVMACGIHYVAQERWWRRIALVALVVCVSLPVYISQRGPYAKNNSDLAEVSSTIRSLASPGDAIIFDETSAPSKRPRLALHTYPQGFSGLDDVLLKTPFTRSATWYDRVYTVDQAYQLDRFDDVRTIWVVEWVSPTGVDTDALDALADHGFHESPIQHRTHATVIYEFTR